MVRSRVRARLAVRSVLVGRLDCEEARGQEDEECGTHRDLAKGVTFIDELGLLLLVCQRYTLFGHRCKNGAFRQARRYAHGSNFLAPAQNLLAGLPWRCFAQSAE